MGLDENPEQHRKLFIGGLSFSTTEEKLKNYFEQFGEVVDCVVMSDPQTHKSRGFGFITYSTIEEVDKCQDSRPHKIDGRTVEPKRAMPREESHKANQSVKKIFVGGLKEVLGEEDLREYFKDFGKIENVEVITEKGTDRPRGFGFVTFDDYDPVDKIILIKSHKINNMPLDIKKAIPKEQINQQRANDTGRMSGGRSSGRGGRGDYGYNRNGFNSDYRDYRSRGYDDYGPPPRRSGGYDSYASGNYFDAPNSHGSYHDSWSGSGGYGSYSRDNYGGSAGPMRQGAGTYRSSGPYGGNSYGGGGGRYNEGGYSGYGRR